MLAGLTEGRVCVFVCLCLRLRERACVYAFSLIWGEDLVEIGNIVAGVGVLGL